MQLEHSFTIPVDLDAAWTALLDLERIAPCLPGARIESIVDGSYNGAVDIKVGPIALTYRGVAEFSRTDPETRTAVLAARTREARGSGQANAAITAQLVAESPTLTRVDVNTDLDITGRPAQFGTGVITEVGARLLGQFADRLAVELARTDGTSPGPGTSVPAPSVPNSTNVLTLVAVPVLKRVALPTAGVLALIAAVLFWRSAGSNRG